MGEYRNIANSGQDSCMKRENQHCACAGANQVSNDNYLSIFSLASIQILILEGKTSDVLEIFYL